MDLARNEISRAARVSLKSGITVGSTVRIADKDWVSAVAEELDQRQGGLFSCGVDFYGHQRRDIGFVDPPVAIVVQREQIDARPLNTRGELIISILEQALGAEGSVMTRRDHGRLVLEPRRWLAATHETEEWRTRKSSSLHVLRSILKVLENPEERLLGLYGAFGYDLVREFEALPEIDSDERTVALYLPDRLWTLDQVSGAATEVTYEFSFGAAADTRGVAREPVFNRFEFTGMAEPGQDFAPGEFARLVRDVKTKFLTGDLFELVASRAFRRPCERLPSEIFLWLRQQNSSPYGVLLNLGANEWLVGASPEMYVRVRDRVVETSPISGTAPRGSDAVADSEHARELLNSVKDESELTMCTDVDRNDKARICVPGSVKVVAHRAIETYPRVLHTVDRVQGLIREQFDGLDAFASHMWAATVTGAPKLQAMRELQFVERTPRRWYGGAFGYLGVDGRIDTGITLRTIQIRDGVAEVRAGCTLLWPSDPDAEEAEAELKASFFLDALVRRNADTETGTGDAAGTAPAELAARNILVVDHEDSFVHMLAAYFRETGSRVRTVRRAGADRVEDLLDRYDPDLVVLSPGPRRPADFASAELVAALVERAIPTFGVCLGLQAIVEYFGGRLSTFDAPNHGVVSEVRHAGGLLFTDIPHRFFAGRYHSLFARRSEVRSPLRITAWTADDTVMALEHETLPIAAVQFHPESLMSLREDAGRKLIRNVVDRLR